jgi:6-methylsalicylic acid synthase
LGLVDVRLRTPVPPGRAQDVQVVLQNRELSLSSRIVEADAPHDAGWLTHTTAFVAADDDIDELLDTSVDLDAARSRCGEPLPAEHVVETLAALGVAAMGFGWRVVELRRGDDELYAVVRSEADESKPTSWASLLDAATSTASTAFDMRLRMPARIERLHVHGGPPAFATVLVRRRPDTTTTDVTIADRSGAALLTIDGMAFEELESSDRGWVDDVGRMVHRIAWHPMTDGGDEPPSGVLLVGGDADGLNSAVKDLSSAAVPFVAVEDARDIEALLVNAESGHLPAELGNRPIVLVLPRSDDAPEASVDLVLRTLLRLNVCGAHTKLWVLTTGVHEGSNLGHAALWGLARVAAAEYPHLWGGAIDLADDGLPLGVLGSAHGHGVVVHRSGVTHVARLAAVESRSGAGTPLHCSPGGTYLITGGTGVLGLRMAQRLADLGARRLLLLSRSGVPHRSGWDIEPRPDSVAAIAALEDRGVSVHVARIDIAAADAADALRAVLCELPPVRGVIHAAGVEAGALLANTTSEDFAAAMRPKVHGTLTLHRVFPPEQLDWMVLFSSCGYLAGFPGQGAYACANSFLDVMARHRRRLGDRTTAVAWTAWRGLGMGSTSDFVAAQLDSLGMGTVVADDAIRALDLAMQADDPNIVVLPLLPAAAAVPILGDVASLGHEPEASGAVSAPQARDLDPRWLAQQVVDAVATQLGLPESEVEPGLPLVELGVDSIMTVRLRRHLEKQTGLSLPPTLLWEHPTAAAVTAKLTEMLGLSPEPDQVEFS